VPKYRIKAEEIAAVWGEDAEKIKSGLNVREKSVPSIDEDTATIARHMREERARAGEDRSPRTSGRYMSAQNPIHNAVKTTSSMVAEAIEATPVLMAADYQFACKAGTAAIQTVMGMVASKMIKYGVAIGADTSQGKPGDALEYTASAGGAAFIIRFRERPGDTA